MAESPSFRTISSHTGDEFQSGALHARTAEEAEARQRHVLDDAHPAGSDEQRATGSPVRRTASAAERPEHGERAFGQVTEIITSANPRLLKAGFNTRVKWADRSKGPCKLALDAYQGNAEPAP